MTSTMFVYRDRSAALDDRPLAKFKLPVKAVFGRRFCDTDGSIGYPTECDPAAVLEAVAECEALNLDATERRDLRGVKKAAQMGKRIFLDWVH